MDWTLIHFLRIWLKGIPHGGICDKSTLVQVMTMSRQKISHYLHKHLRWSLSPNDVTRSHPLDIFINTTTSNQTADRATILRNEECIEQVTIGPFTWNMFYPLRHSTGKVQALPLIVLAMFSAEELPLAHCVFVYVLEIYFQMKVGLLVWHNIHITYWQIHIGISNIFCITMCFICIF